MEGQGKKERRWRQASPGGGEDFPAAHSHHTLGLLIPPSPPHPPQPRSIALSKPPAQPHLTLPTCASPWQLEPLSFGLGVIRPLHPSQPAPPANRTSLAVPPWTCRNEGSAGRTTAGDLQSSLCSYPKPTPAGSVPVAVPWTFITSSLPPTQAFPT